MSFSYKILIIIFLLILLQRLWIIFNSSYTFYSDDAIYAILTKSWLKVEWQNIFHPTWPPLYPLSSALFSLFMPKLEDAARISASVFGTAIVIPLFFLLKRTLSLSCAIAFSLSLAIFSAMLHLSLLPLSDSLSVFLIISGMVSIFFALADYNLFSQKKMLISGAIFFGLAYLTRAEGTMFFFLTAIFLAIVTVLKFQNKIFNKASLPVFIVTFFLVASPYIFATRLQIGEWSLSPKFSAQIQQGHSFALNSRGTTWSQEVVSAKSPNYQSPYFKNGTKFLLDRSSYFLRLYPQKQQKWQQVFLSIFPLWSMPLMLVGIVSLLNKKYRLSMIYLIFIMITAVFMTIFSTPVADIRYLAWTIPFFLFLFYAGIKIFLRNTIITSVAAFLIMITFPGVSLDNMFNPPLVAAKFTENYNRSELRLAGEWIKNNSENQTPKIMARHEGVEYYNGGETIYIPQLEFDQVLFYAKRHKVDYIIAWEEELAGDKELVSLLDMNTSFPILQRVYSTKGSSQIIVYRLKKN